jgi:hypothetical protein
MLDSPPSVRDKLVSALAASLGHGAPWNPSIDVLAELVGVVDWNGELEVAGCSFARGLFSKYTYRNCWRPPKLRVRKRRNVSRACGHLVAIHA